MNKKVMAVAVAGLFAAPGLALAQKSTVEIYGRANLGFDYYKSEGSSVPGADRDARWRVFDGSSRVGFRGTEDLGNGLRAIFQIESGVNVDSGNQNGQSGSTNASSGFWASRDSFVGLDSNFGRVTFGRQSIYWANGVNAQFSANYINTQIPWTDGTALGRVSTTVGNAAFNVARVSNTVQYTSPTFFGINGTFSYSPNAQEAVQGIGAVAGVATKSDGYIWGATGRGTWGPFYAQIDYAENRANTIINSLGSAQPKSQFWKVGGSWGYLPGARLGFIWVQTENNSVPNASYAGLGAVTATGVTTGAKVKQNGYTVNWEHTFGNVQLMAQYGWTDDIKNCAVVGGLPVAGNAVGCDNTKATAFMVGARYFLSKRTWVYLTYNQVSNKENNYTDFFGGNQSSTQFVGGAPGQTGAPFGADPRIAAVGLFHAF